MENYKKYMLKCMLKIDNVDFNWRNETFFFDAEEEMKNFVRDGYKELWKEIGDEVHIKIETAFKLEKLDNNIFKV